MLRFFKRLFAKYKDPQQDKLVYLETPYAGDIQLNVRYARECMKDCLDRGEFPFASHLLYTQPHILRDEIPEQRKLGISAGFAWAKKASTSVFYTDLGITKGMLAGIDAAVKANRKIVARTLTADALSRVYSDARSSS